MKQYRKQAIIVVVFCICLCVAVTVYLYCNGGTLSGGKAMRDDLGAIQSINWYGTSFISLVLIGMLIAIVKAK